jgi:homopolymeric O-antigen transport system permease protein
MNAVWRHGAPESQPFIRIKPTSGWASLQLREVWKYRELLYFLAWRDMKVRYKQTALGVAWAILQPVATTIIFTIFFGRLAGISSDGLPYPLFALAGVLPWNLFSQGLSQSSLSLVGSSQLISKVYFPRLVIPIASVLTGVVDFGVGFLILLGMMAHYHVMPTAAFVFVPFFVLLATSSALGIGLWLSALNVRYRDVRYVVPFFIQIWLFVTPVIYPASRVAVMLKAHGLPSWLYGLNPMATVVEGFRWSAIGGKAVPLSTMAASCAVTVALLVFGAFYFRRTERSFADIV